MAGLQDLGRVALGLGFLSFPDILGASLGSVKAVTPTGNFTSQAQTVKP